MVKETGRRPNVLKRVEAWKKLTQEGGAVQALQNRRARRAKAAAATKPATSLRLRNLNAIGLEGTMLPHMSRRTGLRPLSSRSSAQERMSDPVFSHRSASAASSIETQALAMLAQIMPLKEGGRAMALDGLPDQTARFGPITICSTGLHPAGLKNQVGSLGAHSRLSTLLSDIAAQERSLVPILSHRSTRPAEDVGALGNITSLMAAMKQTIINSGGFIPRLLAAAGFEELAYNIALAKFSD